MEKQQLIKRLLAMERKDHSTENFLEMVHLYGDVCALIALDPDAPEVKIETKVSELSLSTLRDGIQAGLVGENGYWEYQYAELAFLVKKGASQVHAHPNKALREMEDHHDRRKD